MKAGSITTHLANNLKLCLAASAVLVALLSAQNATAQAGKTTNVDGVNVTIALKQTTIDVGGPVTLAITLENVSDNALIDIATNFQLPEGNKLEVMVQPVNELPYHYMGPLDMGTYADTTSKLITGIPLSVDTLLLYDRTQPTGYLFGKPGKYMLSAKFDFRLRKGPTVNSITLPPTEVIVTQPTGAAAEVFELLNEPELAKALHLAAPTTDTLSIFQRAGDRYPGTALGSLALRAAGQFHTHSQNPADRARGAMLLQQYLAGGIVPAGGDGTAWEIAAAWHLNQEYDLARQWIFYLVREYPHSMRIRPEDSLVYYYYSFPATFASQVPWYLLAEPWIVPGTQPPSSLSSRKVD